MVVFLIVLFVISAILLTVVIMIQDDQGGGLGGIFGGGSGTAFGSRSGNVLTRATSILAAVFLLTAFGVAWLNRSPQTEDIEAKARLRSLEQEGGSDDWYVKESDQEAGEGGSSQSMSQEMEAPDQAPDSGTPDEGDEPDSRDTETSGSQ